MSVKVYVSNTIDEALTCLQKESVMVIAGGTNLLVDRKKGKYVNQNLVSIDGIDALKRVEIKEDVIYIGSLVNFSSLETDWTMNQAYYAIKLAASLVGGPQIRNRGTIGGNIISASPAADMIPVLLVLDAGIKLRSKTRERIIPLKQLITGPGKTIIEADELLTEIVLPYKDGESTFCKVGKRNALAISVINQSVYLKMEEGIIKNIAIAVGSAAPTAVRAYETEDYLRGGMPGSHEWMNILENAASILTEEISPIDDIRATKEYRKTLAGNLLMENLEYLTGRKG